jgi:outer membrane lipoprotein-sorting protein
MNVLIAIRDGGAANARLTGEPKSLEEEKMMSRRKEDTMSTRIERSISGTRIGGALMIAASLAASHPGMASGQSPDADRGLAIALEADRRDTGFSDSEVSLRMILRNRHGDESTRAMHTSVLEVEGDGDKAIIVFDEPRDVSGTAFLSHTHKEGSDDQWLYLPALRRVKRIASNNKAGPFMGSEFAYEDISSQEVEKYTYRYVRDEVLDGQPTFVVERDPVDDRSGYSWQLVWYDQAEYRPVKIEFYDRKESLLKTLTFHEYRQHLGQFWRAQRYEMVNHQTGKSTTLQWGAYSFQAGLSDRDFDTNSLRRAR